MLKKYLLAKILVFYYFANDIFKIISLIFNWLGKSASTIFTMCFFSKKSWTVSSLHGKGKKKSRCIFLLVLGDYLASLNNATRCSTATYTTLDLLVVLPKWVEILSEGAFLFSCHNVQRWLIPSPDHFPEYYPPKDIWLNRGLDY